MRRKKEIGFVNWCHLKLNWLGIYRPTGEEEQRSRNKQGTTSQDD